MALYRLDQFVPRLAAGAWVADSAQVIGNVEIEIDASVTFGAILRGDNDRPALPGRRGCAGHRGQRVPGTAR